MADIPGKAGFPPGVVTVVPYAPGVAPPIVDEVFANLLARCIKFIGTVRTPRILAEQAGRALKRRVMELGGYDPLEPDWSGLGRSTCRASGRRSQAQPYSPPTYRCFGDWTGARVFRGGSTSARRTVVVRTNSSSPQRREHARVLYR